MSVMKTCDNNGKSYINVFLVASGQLLFLCIKLKPVSGTICEILYMYVCELPHLVINIVDLDMNNSAGTFSEVE